MEAFDPYAWHDCSLWRLGLQIGGPDQGDWLSDVVLDIDFICEWLRGPDNGMQFRVAPATLVFHNASGLKVNFDWGPVDPRVMLHEVAIDRIEREPIENSYSWTVHANWPAGGAIAFGASDYTQTLLGEPLLLDRQNLTRPERASFAR